MASPAASFAFKLQDATVDAERLGELFLINREQVRRGARRRGGTKEGLFWRARRTRTLTPNASADARRSLSTNAHKTNENKKQTRR